MKTVRRQGGIIQIRDTRITQLTERQNIAFNMCKKKCLNVAQKVEKRSHSAQKSRKCSTLLGI